MIIGHYGMLTCVGRYCRVGLVLSLFYSVLDEVVMEELRDWIDRGFTIVDTTWFSTDCRGTFSSGRRSAFSTPGRMWSTTSCSLLPFRIPRILPRIRRAASQLPPPLFHLILPEPPSACRPLLSLSLPALQLCADSSFTTDDDRSPARAWRAETRQPAAPCNDISTGEPTDDIPAECSPAVTPAPLPRECMWVRRVSARVRVRTCVYQCTWLSMCIIWHHLILFNLFIRWTLPLLSLS